jgi:hypothetical protein
MAAAFPQEIAKNFFFPLTGFDRGLFINRRSMLVVLGNMPPKTSGTKLLCDSEYFRTEVI